MGLLDGFKKAMTQPIGEARKDAAPDSAPAAKPEQKAKAREEFDSVRVNLSDKMLRVELDGEDGFVKYGTLKLEGDNRIRIVSSGRVLIAEVTKRSKVFKELEPYVGRNVQSIEIYPKTGDYGNYYQVRMKFNYFVVG